MAYGSLRLLRAAQHAGHFFDSLSGTETPDSGLYPASLFSLFHHKMLRCKNRDLGQMCDAQHLLRLAQRLQLPSYGFCGPTADADVDLVEDQRARQQRSAFSFVAAG